jgi:hypothetical protein
MGVPLSGEAGGFPAQNLWLEHMTLHMLHACLPHGTKEADDLRKKMQETIVQIRAQAATHWVVCFRRGGSEIVPLSAFYRGLTYQTKDGFDLSIVDEEGRDEPSVCLTYATCDIQELVHHRLRVGDEPVFVARVETPFSHDEVWDGKWYTHPVAMQVCSSAGEAANHLFRVQQYFFSELRKMSIDKVGRVVKV